MSDEHSMTDARKTYRCAVLVFAECPGSDERDAGVMAAGGMP